MKQFNEQKWERFTQTFDNKPEVADVLIVIMKLCFCASCILCAIFVLA